MLFQTNGGPSKMDESQSPFDLRPAPKKKRTEMGAHVMAGSYVPGSYYTRFFCNRTLRNVRFIMMFQVCVPRQ